MFDFGERLKNLRNSKGLTQAQVASKINKTAATVSRYENNTKTPPLETLIDLVVLYNTSLDYIIGIGKNSISTDGLTERQAKIISNIVDEFKSNKSAFKELTRKQQEILNELLVEFTSKK